MWRGAVSTSCHLLLDGNSDLSLLKTDISNAFNCISRQHLLDEVAEKFPQIYRHTCQMYSNASSLIYVKGGDVITVRSEEEVHQGDPLGPFLFSAALQPILESLQENHNNLTVLAHLDDLFVVGKFARMQPFISDLQSSLKDVGLLVNEKKREFFNTSDSVQSFGSVPVVSHGTEILGIPIGCHQFVQTRCSEIANSGHALCSELVKLRCPQSATLLLRFAT